MTKIVVEDSAGGYNIAAINRNFQVIAQELNDKVLYRDNPPGEPNAVLTEIDMNGKRLYNLPAPVANSEAARLKDVLDAIAGAKTATLTEFTPYLDIVSDNVQGAIQEVKDDILTNSALLASTAGAANVGTIRPITGAVARTLQQEVNDHPVSVKVFGAVGDGVADDTVAIQAAITWANVVHIPEGNYRVSTLKINKNNFRMYGDGYNRSILTTNAGSFVAIEVAGEASVTGLFLNDFKLQGNSTNLGGIKMGSASFYCAIPVFENLNIWDFSRDTVSNGYGIQLNQVQNATFHNCWVYRNRHGYQRPNGGYCTSSKVSGKSSYIGEGYIGVYIDGQTDDFYLDDAVLEGNDNSAIIITANAVSGDRGSTLFSSGAYFEANNDLGAGVVYVTGGAGTYQNHVVVIDRANFATNTGYYVSIDRAIVTIKNSKIVPQQCLSTANSTLHFEHNYYPTAADYFSGYRALLGNVTAIDKNSAVNAQTPNQINFVNAITFPAVPRLVSDPNTLDDYQERVSGQWTPTHSGFGGTVNTIAGRYVKIGRTVHLEITITGTALTTTWLTSGVTIPFPCALSTSGSIMNVTTGLSPGGVYLDASTDSVLIPTIASSNAVLVLNVTYIADEA